MVIATLTLKQKGLKMRWQRPMETTKHLVKEKPKEKGWQKRNRQKEKQKDLNWPMQKPTVTERQKQTHLEREKRLGIMTLTDSNWLMQKLTERPTLMQKRSEKAMR